MEVFFRLVAKGLVGGHAADARGLDGGLAGREYAVFNQNGLDGAHEFVSFFVEANIKHTALAGLPEAPECSRQALTKH